MDTWILRTYYAPTITVIDNIRLRFCSSVMKNISSLWTFLSPHNITSRFHFTWSSLSLLTTFSLSPSSSLTIYPEENIPCSSPQVSHVSSLLLCFWITFSVRIPHFIFITLLPPHIILFTSNYLLQECYSKFGSNNGSTPWYLLLHITFPLTLSSPPHNPFPHIILSFSLSSPPSHDLLLLHTIFSTHISVIWHHPPISSCELTGRYLHANFPA